MLDTSKLSPELVNDIASNLGWRNCDPIEPYLERIAELTPEKALAHYAEWHLEDAGWAKVFIDGIDALRKAKK